MKKLVVVGVLMLASLITACTPTITRESSIPPSTNKPLELVFSTTAAAGCDWAVYVDGVEKYTTHGRRLSTYLDVPEGTHEVRTTCTDPLGSIAEEKFEVVVDKTPPQIQVKEETYSANGDTLTLTIVSSEPGKVSAGGKVGDSPLSVVIPTEKTLNGVRIAFSDKLGNAGTYNHVPPPPPCEWREYKNDRVERSVFNCFANPLGETRSFLAWVFNPPGSWQAVANGKPIGPPQQVEIPQDVAFWKSFGIAILGSFGVLALIALLVLPTYTGSKMAKPIVQRLASRMEESLLLLPETTGKDNGDDSTWKAVTMALLGKPETAEVILPMLESPEFKREVVSIEMQERKRR
jgi:hypothetical protein